MGRVIASGRNLAEAHRDLLQAELGAILEELKGIAAVVGGIIGLAIFAAGLVAVGTPLFLGEWIFGSLGWGILHGALLCALAIFGLALVVVGAPRSVLTRGVAGGFLLGVLSALALGANVGRQGATWLASQLQAGPLPGLPSDWGPAVVGVVAGALVLGIVGLAASLRVTGLGLFGGALIGWWVAGMEFSWQGAVAVGVAIGLGTAIAIMAWNAGRAGLDPSARFRGLYPQASVEAARQSKAWLEDLWKKRRGKGSNP
jgi:MFS family permease